jgi:hypothetical protein
LEKNGDENWLGLRVTHAGFIKTRVPNTTLSVLRPITHTMRSAAIQMLLVHSSPFTTSSSTLVIQLSRSPAACACCSLRLPITVMSLESTSYRLIIFRLIHKTNLRLIACKSNRTLLIASHAARVEQASPKEDPIHNISIVTRLMSARRYLPIEEAQPKQQPLPLVDLNPVDPQPLLSNMLVLSVRTRCTS